MTTLASFQPSSLLRPAPASVEVPSRLAAGCQSVRRDKLLLYAAHSGFGNQELSLRKALLLAYVLNRTLILPPLLQQSDLGFGPPELRCNNRSWLRGLEARAERLYLRKVFTGAYESFSLMCSFTLLRSGLCGGAPSALVSRLWLPAKRR